MFEGVDPIRRGLSSRCSGSLKDLPTRARVQAYRLWSALALNERVPRAIDRHSPALFTRGEISHIRIWSAG
jgi:hypothetical protein